MDLKKKSHSLKSRAKELGYEIKLTHAQELVATIHGHETRHSALIQDKTSTSKLSSKYSEADAVSKNPGMIVNKNCQSCQKNPRTNARFLFTYNPHTYLLCDECVKPSSKFYTENGAKDVTPHHDLTATCLRDIFFEVKGEKTWSQKSFMFQLICSDNSLGDRYLFIPGLGKGEGDAQVWNVDLNESANGWWDWKIIVLPQP